MGRKHMKQKTYLVLGISHAQELYFSEREREVLLFAFFFVLFAFKFLSLSEFPNLNQMLKKEKEKDEATE